MKTEIEKVETKEVAEPENVQISLIEKALASGADLEKLERLFDLLLKKDAVEAKKAYVRAMASFKENPPSIIKDKENSQYRSMYVTLGNLVNSVNPSLSKNGLSSSWDIQQNGIISVTCKITHCMGHSEQATASAPADTSGSKNAIQQIKSTITYLKSVTFESILGLASSDANYDDDGYCHTDCISDEQANVISDRIIDSGIDINKFCKYMKITDIKELPLKKYDFAIKAIENAKNNTKEKKK